MWLAELSYTIKILVNYITLFHTKGFLLVSVSFQLRELRCFLLGLRELLFSCQYCTKSCVYLAGILMLVPMQFILVMIRDWLVLGTSVSRVFWKSVLMFTGWLSAMFLSTSCWLSLSTTFMLMSWVCNKCVSVIFVNNMLRHCCATWLNLYLINTRIFLTNILFLLRLHLIPTGSPDNSFEMSLVHQLLYTLNFGSLSFCRILSLLALTT